MVCHAMSRNDREHREEEGTEGLSPGDEGLVT